MVKEKEVEAEAPVTPTTDREKRWKAYVANYKIINPVKGARKEANGELKSPPPSFK